MSAVTGKSRSDDVGRVKKAIVELAKLPGDLVDKRKRGFKDNATARLLCPMTLLEDFDLDPDE